MTANKHPTDRDLRLVRKPVDRRRRIARAMARVDVELWDSQRLLPQIIATRARPGALSCEWTDREIAAVAGDLREYLTQADLEDVITRAYPDALRAELERLAR